MLEFISALVEATIGYVNARLMSKGYSLHTSALLVATSSAVIFFVGMAIDEIISPAPEESGKGIVQGLFMFSGGIFFIVYMLMLLDGWIKKRRANKSNEQNL